MTISRHLVVAIAVLSVVSVEVWPRELRAEPHVRNGWYAGLGYGGNYAKLDLADSQGYDEESEWSGTLNLRAGFAIDQNLLLGAEYIRWTKDYAIANLQGDIPADVTLSGTVLAVTYFPGNAGFMMRGGLGVAMANVAVEPPPQIADPPTDLEPDPGLAFLVATGYEARLTTRFALAGEFDVLYLGVSGDAIDHIYIYGINFQFNWYW